MNVQLLYPHSNYESKYFVVEPPLGVLSIASVIKQNLPDVNIEILDSGLLSRENIESDIGSSCEIVGISCSLINYSPYLADIATQRGAKVFLGGPYPSVRVDEILKNQPSIEGVIVGEGEEPFLQLCRDIPYEEIPNLYFRRDEDIVCPNNKYTCEPHNFPRIDWSLIDLKEYSRRSITDTELQASIYSMKGCSWREKTNGCVYCSIYDPQTKVKSPRKFWEEVEELAQMGVTHVRDVSDDLPSVDWLSTVLETRPNNLSQSPTFFRYIGVRHINEQVVELLSNLNYKQIFVGFESGDNAMLRSARKGVESDDNIRAASLFAEYNISIIGSWVLGLEGEDEKSLGRTLSCAKEINRVGEVFAYNSPILMPIPGSHTFNQLNEALNGEYAGLDQMDIHELQSQWVGNFCNVEMNKLKEYQQLITGLTPLELNMI